ncbi:hypothetical protein K8O68_20865 [Salipaludibacillus sp. CUR1]|uniref:hypothetical protein n=1 Tax=Salipaludibacillus sp. CUR1 TaxID=2820003 RepID=UPI001E4DFE10|nr:hypothetical protein [Salipaludibacillus sp. CUR1]MCE7794843.1 hypothetical protein [Salipaludibacillus sp. CUR1]
MGKYSERKTWRSRSHVNKPSNNMTGEKNKYKVSHTKPKKGGCACGKAKSRTKAYKTGFASH